MVTEHFSSEEFGQPARHGFAAEPYPAEWIAMRLLPLCVALETIRGAGAGPLRITSGFRSLAYNKAIGGARHSQHVEGRAADFVAARLSVEKTIALVAELYRDGAIRIGGLGCYPTFTHVDTRPGDRLARWRGTRR